MPCLRCGGGPAAEFVAASRAAFLDESLTLPLHLLILFVFCSGVGAALAGHHELRANPRSSLLSRAFHAYASFILMLMLPVALYFYLFYGDWFLLYTIDTSRIPSALVLVGFMVLCLVAAGGFRLGAASVRGQRERLAYLLLGASSFAGMLSVVWLRRRMGVMASYLQFHGVFGASSLSSSSLLYAVILALMLLGAGYGYLLLRLLRSRRTSD